MPSIIIISNKISKNVRNCDVIRQRTVQLMESAFVPHSRQSEIVNKNLFYSHVLSFSYEIDFIVALSHLEYWEGIRYWLAGFTL